MNKPRLTLVMSHHYAGGAERVMSIMANYWAAKGWQIHLYTLTEADKPPFYPLHEAIKWQGLGLSQPLGNPFLGIIRIYGRLRRLRLAIQQTSPDAVISFNDETNVVTLLAMLGLGVTAIVGERNDPHCHKMNNPWRLLRPLVYRQAAFVVTQTQHALGYFSKAIRSRTKVIPNPVIRPSETEEHYVHGNPSPRSKVILAMGRLEQQKGFDLLIQAFSKVTAKHPDYTLEIWGEGQERTKLENMVADMKLEGRVSLPGVTKAPHEKMQKANLFVLSSRYEGFPNVLCEAMACGMPVISFNCHSGPSEIIREGIDGILVPDGDANALADAMDCLLSDESERIRLANHATEITERFGIDKIMDEWAGLIAGNSD